MGLTHQWVLVHSICLQRLWQTAGRLLLSTADAPARYVWEHTHRHTHTRQELFYNVHLQITGEYLSVLSVFSLRSLKIPRPLQRRHKKGHKDSENKRIDRFKSHHMKTIAAVAEMTDCSSLQWQEDNSSVRIWRPVYCQIKLTWHYVWIFSFYSADMIDPYFYCHHLDTLLTL